jgi:hypothetical protein
VDAMQATTEFARQIADDSLKFFFGKLVLLD